MTIISIRFINIMKIITIKLILTIIRIRAINISMTIIIIKLIIITII